MSASWFAYYSVAGISDFPSLAEGKEIPYGHTRSEMTGRRSRFGVTHAPVQFAVESIRRWWKLAGPNQEAKGNLVCGCRRQ